MAGLLGSFEEAGSWKLISFGGNSGADELMRHGYGACLSHFFISCLWYVSLVECCCVCSMLLIADLLTRIRLHGKEKATLGFVFDYLVTACFFRRTMRRIMNQWNDRGSIHRLLFVGVSCCCLFRDVEKSRSTPCLWRDEGWNWWVADTV